MPAVTSPGRAFAAVPMVLIVAAIPETGGAAAVHQLSHMPGSHSAGLGQAIPSGAREQIKAPLTAAFAHTFAWTVGLAIAALVPPGLLALAERSKDRDLRISASTRASLHDHRKGSK